MKDLKGFFIFIAIWFLFGRISYHLVESLTEIESDGLVGVSCSFLPVICLIVYRILREAKAIVLFFMGIFALFLNLFRRKKIENFLEDGEANSFKDSLKFTLICVLTYSIAGWLVGRFHENEIFVFIYAFIGICWSFAVYFCLKKGWIDSEF